MNSTAKPSVSLQGRYVNRINGKTYIVLSEKNGIVAVQQENRKGVWYLGRAEFNRRLTPMDCTPVSSLQVKAADARAAALEEAAKIAEAQAYGERPCVEGEHLMRLAHDGVCETIAAEIRDLIKRNPPPSPRAMAPPVPQLWAECGYCKHAGEEECLHRADDLRWDGEQWCCAECTGDDDHDRWEASPRLAPQTNTKLDPTAVFHREMTEAEVDHATEIVFAIRRLAVGKTVDEIVSALVAITSALICENAPSRNAAKSYWRTFHKQMTAVINDDFDKFIRANQGTSDLTTSEGAADV